MIFHKNLSSSDSVVQEKLAKQVLQFLLLLSLSHKQTFENGYLQGCLARPKSLIFCYKTNFTSLPPCITPV